MTTPQGNERLRYFLRAVLGSMRHPIETWPAGYAWAKVDGALKIT